MKTRGMHVLMSTAVARVSAVEELGTAPPRLLSALALRTEVVSLVRFQGHLAESTLPRILLLLILLAVLANVVWLRFARNAEIVTALVAAHTVLAHVLGSSFGDLLAVVCLVVVVYCSFEHFDCVAALAPDHALVLLYD